MAESIGGKIRNTLVGVLVALLVLAFALWGVNDVFQASAKDAVVTVGDEKISVSEFKTRFERELEDQNRKNQTSLTSQEAYNRGLHNQVIGQMLTELVIAKDANELGIGADHDIAREIIRNNPSFMNDVTKEFSKEIYEQRVSSIYRARSVNDATLRYEDQLFRDIRRMQTVPAIIGGVNAPSDLADQKYNFATEQRKASILTLTKDAVEAPDVPDDQILKDYITRNAARYTAPEYRQILILRLENADFARDLTVTDEELKGEFDRRVAVGLIGSKETRSFVQIDADSEAGALKVVERLERGDDPTVVATGLGLPSPEYYVDVLPDAVLIPEASDTAFAIEEDEAKAVLGALGGWHVVKVTAITPAVSPDLDSVRAEIREAVLNNKAASATFELSKQVDEALLENRTIEEISADLKYPYASLDYIDRSGTTRDGIKMTGFGEIPGVAADDTLLQEIFTSDILYETDMFETETAGFATIKVMDIIDSQVKSFEEVKDEALKDWTNEQIESKLAEFSRELSLRIQNGETIEEVATSLGDVATVYERAFTRLNPPRDLGPQVIVDLYSAEIGEVVRGDGALPLTRQIGKLLEIAPNRDAIGGEYLDFLRDRATVEISSDLISAYQQDVLKSNGSAEYPEQVKSALGIQTIE